MTDDKTTRPRVTPEESRLIHASYAKGHYSIRQLAILTGHCYRTIRNVLAKPAPDGPDLTPCPVCEILIEPGQDCPYCAADAEARAMRRAELDDSLGPTLPPIGRETREGPPLCEVLLGG